MYKRQNSSPATGTSKHKTEESQRDKYEDWQYSTDSLEQKQKKKTDAWKEKLTSQPNIHITVQTSDAQKGQ